MATSKAVDLESEQRWSKRLSVLFAVLTIILTLLIVREPLDVLIHWVLVGIVAFTTGMFVYHTLDYIKATVLLAAKK